MTKQRWAILGLIAISLIFLAVVLVLYRAISKRANFRPMLSSGGAAQIQLPPGFEATIYAQDLSGPRFIAFGPDGTLYVADRGNNRIVSLPDIDGDHQADEVRVFAEGLDQPHSLAYHEGAWYVGVPSGIVRLTDTNEDGQAEDQEILIDNYPTEGAHRTRTVEFLPDGRMVVSIGSSCNACVEEDPRQAAILVYDDPAATGERLFATGLRNAVGLAIHPDTGQLWATENGRDMMGDDLPPDSVYIVEEALAYGWPTCHGGDVIDPELGGPDACQDVGRPVAQLQAHSAPLGLAFYTGDDFPEEYQGDLFIAYHGSWNRSEPTGYKVVRLPLDGSQPAGPIEDFAFGWLDDETNQASGRPVGLAVGPDGALYVSDDKGGIIYRINFDGPDSQ